MGGPVRKDRLWFFAADRWWGAQNNVSGSWYNKTPRTFIYTPDLSRPGYTSAPHHNDSVRFTWQPAAKHKIAGSVELQSNCICFWTVESFHAPEASGNLAMGYKGTRLYQTTWSFPATNRLLFEAGYSGSKRHASNTTRTEGVKPTDIPILDLSTNFFYDAVAQNGQFALNYSSPNQGHSYTDNQRASMSYVTGSHAFKTGMTVLVQNGWGGGSALNQTPYGPVRFEFRGGTNGVAPVPASITQFLSPTGPDPAQKTRAGQRNVLLGLYAQDQWTLRRLTLNLGVRYDAVSGQIRAIQTLPNDFVGALDFPGRDHIPLWKDVTPRLGVAFDLFGTGKTAVKASVGKYMSGFDTNATTGANAPSALSGTDSTRTWIDANKDFVPDCDLKNAQANGECGRLANLSLGQKAAPSTTFDPTYLVGWGERGYIWQIAVNLQHELRPGMALNAGYFRTPTANFIARDNRAVTPADYSSFCARVPTDPRLGVESGTQACGLFDLNPAKFGFQDVFVTRASAFGHQTSLFNGFEVGLNARFGKGGLVQGGVANGQTVTDNCFTVDSPQAQRPGFCHVTLPWAKQTQVKFSGNYPLPWWGVQVSGTYQNLPGPTYGANRLFTSAEVVSSLGRNLSAGTVLVPLVKPNTLWEPRFDQVDLRFAKILRIGKTRVQGQFDVYNAFNGSDVLAVNSTYGAIWRNPTAILAPRLIKFGAQVDF